MTAVEHLEERIDELEDELDDVLAELEDVKAARVCATCQRLELPLGNHACSLN